MGLDVDAACAAADRMQRRIEKAIEASKRGPEPEEDPIPPPPAPITTPVGTKRHLVLGNGPSLSLHDLEAIQKRPEVTTYGVNRLPIVPDWYCAVDRSIEEKWHPPIGECKGVLTTAKNSLCERSDAIVRAWYPLPKDSQWRTPPTGKYYSGRVSGSFVVQWALENGARDIGLLGIEYSGRDLHRKKEKSHWFGTHDPAIGSPTLGSRKRVGYRFWTALRDHCAREGIRLVNLVEYETPFHEIGIHQMSMSEWLDDEPSCQ